MKKKYLTFIVLSFAMFVNACSPTTAASPTEPAPPASTEAPTVIPPTNTPEVDASSGWETHTDSQLHFSVSYPSEMQGVDSSEHSWILSVKTPNADETVRNFIYVSVIPAGLQGASGEVYNYDPLETGILLVTQVGESKSLRDNTLEGFTYTRLPDTTINGRTATAFENVQPWEFPTGTKEIRYYLKLEGFTILLGAYVDTQGSGQPGAVTEDLFNQIIATFQVMP